MGGAKVDSLGGIGFFRPLLELLTTLDEYKTIGPKRSLSHLAIKGGAGVDEQLLPIKLFSLRFHCPGKRVITFAAESSEP